MKDGYGFQISRIVLIRLRARERVLAQGQIVEQGLRNNGTRVLYKSIVIYAL
jgi:hypothetical protein